MKAKSILSSAIVITAFLFQFSFASTSHAKIIYVDDDATGNNVGASWADAFNRLQDALAIAQSGDEICVAQGIYKPDQGAGIAPGDYKATFKLISGVTIKGSYAGAGTPDPNARDIQLYETILSGDLNGNDRVVNDPCDLLDDPYRAENSYHVVTGSGTDETAALDGFTITSGNADGQFPNSCGGGIFNDSGSPWLSNCTFSGNSAKYGGGMSSRSGRPMLTNCTFVGNSAGSFGGGLEYSDSNSPTLTDCTFIGNSAKYSGGGMCDGNSSPTLINCTFSGNTGSGMLNVKSMPKLIKCTFSGNSAYWGGGIETNESSPMIINCIFSGNSAWRGGAMSNSGSRATLTNCTFSGNSAIYEGGVVHNQGGYVTPIGSVEGGSLTLTNCTFSGNSAAEGNAIACDSMGQFFPSDLQVTNCVLWDGGDEIWNNDVSTITITYSDVQGGWPSEGNIDDDPLFIEPGYWDANGTPDDANDDVWVVGDYHLLPGSPCIDAGDPNYVPGPNETDLDGRPRIIEGRIDMGAYEYNPPISAEARIIPRTINLASKGNWITCYIRLPEGYNVADIDPNSVFLEEQIKAEQLSVNEQQQVAATKFIRENVQPILEVGEIELTITGRLTDGTIFEATDVIRVLNKSGGKSPK